jgi:membrane associated rhomboid family serine protease
VDKIPLPSTLVARSGPGTILGAIRGHLFLLGGLLGLMWGSELVDSLPGLHLDQYGIRPRSAAGLAGIFFAPFLHGGFEHLLLNSPPFLVLGGIVLVGGLRVFWATTILITILGGIGVWLVGDRASVHLGASGLIFGYLGLLLARGFYERSVLWIVVSVGVMFCYGGLLSGVLPIQRGVSWESHLFGFLAGIGAARLLFRKRSRAFASLA